MPFVIQGNVHKWTGEHPQEDKPFLQKAWASLGVEGADGVVSRNGRPPTPAEVAAGWAHSSELITPEKEAEIVAAGQVHGAGRWGGLHDKRYPDGVKSQLEQTLGRTRRERG